MTPPMRRPAILVVDDHPANLAAMTVILSSLEADLHTAASGREALILCMEHDYALVLLDVQMPEMDGYEVARLLRGAEKMAMVPILFLTAVYADERHALLGYEAGAVDFIFKPVNDRILLSKVRVFLELHNTREELRQHRDHLSRLVRERTASLERAQQELRGLTHHLTLVREEERRRIALAVHDEMGNALAHLKMTLEWLQQSRLDPARMNQELEQLRFQVEDTIAKVRHLTLMLRPPILDQCGLLAALEWQAAEFARASGLTCQVTPSSHEIDLEESAKLALFRILQESLTNVGRHARASAVQIDLARVQGRVQLTISDDGVGIPEEILTDPARNFGLRGMEERACQNGGELHIETSDQGTRIIATLPLPKAHHGELP